MQSTNIYKKQMIEKIKEMIIGKYNDIWMLYFVFNQQSHCVVLTVACQRLLTMMMTITATIRVTICNQGNHTDDNDVSDSNNYDADDGNDYNDHCNVGSDDDDDDDDDKQVTVSKFFILFQVENT